MIKVYKKISSDLLIILIWIITTFIFVTTPALEKSAARTILGMPLILFIPGYVLVATFFPKKDDLEPIKRIVISFGMSMVVVPLLGLILNFTFGIRLIPILIALCSYSIVFTFVANYRRTQLPEDLRFDIRLSKIYDIIKVEIVNQSRTDEILMVVLLLSVMVATGALVYVTNITKMGERTTEFYILGPSGKADGYQTELIVNEPVKYMIGISNHEYSTVNYTIKMVLGEDTLLSKDVTIDNNQKWEQNLTITPNIKATDKKLNFLLFKENIFVEPYRELHLWVNAT